MACFAYCINQEANIVIFRDMNISLDLTITEATNILSNFDWVSNLNNSSVPWEYIDKGFIWDQYIKISSFAFSNIKINLKDYSNSTINDSGCVVTGNFQVLSVVITFNYDSRTAFNTYPAGTGVLIVYI